MTVQGPGTAAIVLVKETAQSKNKKYTKTMTVQGPGTAAIVLVGGVLWLSGLKQSLAFSPITTGRDNLIRRFSSATEQQDAVAAQELSFTSSGVELPESQYAQVMSSSLPIASRLRQTYDDLFADPRQPDMKRVSETEPPLKEP
jgi:hypothetical protein